MVSLGGWISSLPDAKDFFPPTPQAYSLIATLFKWIPPMTLAQWTPLRHLQAMGKTSSKDSKVNLPGRYAWSIAEAVGPLNLLFILYTLPRQLYPQAHSPTSLFATGLPIQNEMLGLLYVAHYINRAGVIPLYLAPSMSPIHPIVASLMALFQYLNSSSIAGWLVYSAYSDKQNAATSPIVSLPAALGISLFIAGLAGNITAETTLFSLRRAAARRKAKSEGRATVTYDKVYVIPPPEGLYKNILFPHYALEWLEWTGYWILGGAWGLSYGWSKSAALWFLINELCTMLPRAYEGRQWYIKRFGARAVGKRSAAIPGII